MKYSSIIVLLPPALPINDVRWKCNQKSITNIDNPSERRQRAEEANYLTIFSGKIRNLGKFNFLYVLTVTELNRLLQNI